MSADNGIYILPILCSNKESTQIPKITWVRWRVIEAGGIDNVTFEPDCDDGHYNAEQLERYFGDAPEFECEHEAILYGHKLAEDITVLEYGVSVLEQTSYRFKKKHKAVKHSPQIYKFDGGVDEKTLWLVDENGNHIASVTRLMPDRLPSNATAKTLITSGEEWQKIVDTIVLAPQFIELAKEQYVAIKDIINTADNNQPYNAKELEDNFMQYCEKFRDLMKMFHSASEVEYCENH